MRNLTKSPFLEAKMINKVVESGSKPLYILSDINLTVDEGKSLAILGPSGCGKSTLLGILAGLDTPSSGDVLWRQKVVSSLNEEERATLRNGFLGFVFQSFHLLPHLNAIENVMLPLELAGINDAEKIAFEMIKSVDLLDRVEHFPKTLSGGEQQRVALARAFAVNPKLLLADEPTGSLDHANGEIVKDLLFDFQQSRGTTLIVVTHDQELAKMCDHRLQLKSGKVSDFNEN